MRPPSAQSTRDIALKLVAWYEAHGRDLPFRHTKDPYKIWVSEVMLQQTRVETVIPYYTDFLEQFPTAHALADAPADDVLRAFAGMGYYRRARYLHEGAREVVERFDGKFPVDRKQLESVKGIGPYTAGAILSFAFDQPAAIVDGNVARFLARLLAIETDVDRGDGKAKVWEMAQRLVESADPRLLNNASIEIGARVCVPREPKCDECPVNDFCGAKIAGLVAKIPKAKSKKASPEVADVAFVIARANGKVLLAQNGDDGLYRGLWEPPRIAGNEDEALEQARAVFGKLTVIKRAHVTHILSHRVLKTTVLRCDLAKLRRALPAAGTWGYVQFAWCAPADYALSTYAKKILHAATLVAK